MTTLRQAAIHEAGHAIIGEMLGFKPLMAAVWTDANKRWCGRHYYRIPIIPMKERRWGTFYVSIAGRLAESLCGYADMKPFSAYFASFQPCCKREGSFSQQSDGMLARIQAKELSGAPELFTEETFIEFLDVAEREVRPMLLSPAPWAALHGVADRLMQVGQVDEHGFGPIFERANFNTRNLQPN